ncbi:CIC_collapsed_G0037390.mRNA.1.CDS.1 [Saccharomyces cerevisiae]|nr:CIC_collapsed_G0037390.mRNA.1.CDS.1 [Saccharomyces cerevisiae]
MHRKTRLKEIDKELNRSRLLSEVSQGAACSRNISYFTMENPWYRVSGFCSIPGILKQHKNGINVKTPIFHLDGDMDPSSSYWTR